MLTKTRILCSASVLAAVMATPALAQTAQTTPAQPAQTSQEATVIDEVVVTGFRRSLQSAQAVKRNSDQIVDSIVAEDIGKLPDTTASDSLARVTGVQVGRGGGEAGQVLVRGLPDITTSYNGRDIFTAEARFVAVQDFPAGGVAVLEVYKSTTADQVEGGIAGLINVRSRRPFDFSGREIAGAVRGTYATQSGKYDPNGNLLISNRWDTDNGEIGALLNVSYTQLRYLDSARFNGGYIAGMRADQNAAFAGSRFPDGVGIFYGVGDRSRPSVNAALQWRPDDKSEVYADFLYQGFRNKVSDRQLFVPLFGGSQITNVVLQPGTDQVQSFTSTNQVRPELFQGATDNETDTFQLAIGGRWEDGPWRVTADLARTDSKYVSSIFSFDTAFTSAPVVDVNFNVPEEDGGVEFSFRNFDVNDPANYRYRGLFDRRLVAKGEDIQARMDVNYELGDQGLRSIQAGYRVVDRDGSFDNGERYSYQEFLNIPLGQKPIEVQVIPGGFEGSDIQPTRTWVSPTRGSIRENIVLLREQAGFLRGDPPYNPVQRFSANETSYAGYLQAKFGFDDLVFPIDGVLGIRAVKTEEAVTGFTRTVVGGAEVFTPQTAESEYTDYLPNASARIHLTDDIQLRLSATKTRTRPTFSQLNPGFFVDPNIDPVTGRRNANSGNIDLKPLESDNYDISLEYYFSNTGSASLAAFRREVSGFIVNERVNIDDPALGPLSVNRPINLDDTKLEGLEAAFTSFFDYDFLPDWASGFGIQVNGTYIDGELPGISDFSYNVTGIYEQGPLSARLAWNSRSEFLNFPCEGGTGNPGCEYTDDVSRLDFALNYTPIENITVSFDASNILGEPLTTRREYLPGDAGPNGGTFPRDVRFEETIYSLGLRFRY